MGILDNNVTVDNNPDVFNDEGNLPYVNGFRGEFFHDPDNRELRDLGEAALSSSRAIIEDDNISIEDRISNVQPIMNFFGDEVAFWFAEKFHFDFIRDARFWDCSRFLDGVTFQLETDISRAAEYDKDLLLGFSGIPATQFIVHRSWLSVAQEINENVAPLILPSGDVDPRFIFPLDKNNNSHRDFVKDFFRIRARSVYGNGGPVDTYMSLRSRYMLSGLNLSPDVYIKESVNTGKYDLIRLDKRIRVSVLFEDLDSLLDAFEE